MNERRLPGEVRLNNLRQIRAPRAALVIQVARLLPRAVGRDLVEPIEQLGVNAVAHNFLSPDAASIELLSTPHHS